ncbi:MAG: hypothetical protein PVJ17_04020, partial [Lysobacterales bacterium]
MNAHLNNSLLVRPILAVCLAAVLLAACGKEQGTEPAETANTTPAPAVAPAAEESGEVGADAINEADYRRHVEILASDEFGGRGPGTHGEDLTVDYLVSRFKEYGLEPANGDSYTQDVPLTSVEVVNDPDLVISGGEDDDLVLAYRTEQVMGTR